jgi:hypothetical protein
MGFSRPVDERVFGGNSIRCNSCVLEELPGLIDLDHLGVCNQCRSHNRLSYKGEDELLRQIQNSKNKNSKYDCAVMLSGGRDSTYTLLKLVKDRGLNVLAINYLNPMTHPLAKENIENAVKTLNVDLVSFKVPRDLHERSFRQNLASWYKKPDPAMVPMMCIACKQMWYHTLRIVKRHHISCLVAGGNPLEETSFKKELLNVSHDTPMETTMIKSTVGILKGIVRNPRYLVPEFIPTMVLGFLFADAYSFGSRIYGSNIQRHNLFTYIPWNEREIIGRITNELDWKYPPGGSTWRFDCQVETIKSLMYQTTVGMTEKEDFYSMMIRENMITRDQATEYLEVENRIDWNGINDLLAGAGVFDISFTGEMRSGLDAYPSAQVVPSTLSSSTMSSTSPLQDQPLSSIDIETFDLSE